MIDNYIFDKDVLFYLQSIKTKNEYKKIIDNIQKIIRSTDYLELLKEYKEYVNNISNLFIKLKINNPLEVCLLYNDLLFDGYFSIDKHFDLVDNTKFDLLVKTWGSRVCTGHSVCRHNALLLVDIERNLGNISECVDLICVNKNKLIKQKLINYQKIKTPNHLAVGLQIHNDVYLYDPNNYYFLFRKDDINNEVINFIGIEKSLKCIDKTITIFNKNENDNNINFNNVSIFNEINRKYITEINDKITKVYSLNETTFNNFYMDNSKKVRKIAYLNNEIILKQKLYK